MTTHQAVRQTLIDLTQTAEQAASEIVRLREENTSLKREILVYHDDRLKLSNEVDQLRAALGLTAYLKRKPVDELVADLVECGNCHEGLSDMDHVCKKCLGAGWVRNPDTTPPAAQRQWVGLTDDEIKAVIAKIDPNEHYLPNALRQLSLALEAKLKEKNSD